MPAGARQYDAAADQPYLTFATPTDPGGCGQPVQYVPYEDEQSIQAKGEWSMAHGYGGVIIWTLEEMPHSLMVAAEVGFLSVPIGP